MLKLDMEKFETISIDVDGKKFYLSTINRPVITAGLSFSHEVLIVSPKEFNGVVTSRWNAGAGTEFTFGTKYGNVDIKIGSVIPHSGIVSVWIKADKRIYIHKGEVFDEENHEDVALKATRLAISRETGKPLES